jgi:hypothetical protein
VTNLGGSFEDEGRFGGMRESNWIGQTLRRRQRRGTIRSDRRVETLEAWKNI